MLSLRPPPVSSFRSHSELSMACSPSTEGRHPRGGAGGRTLGLHRFTRRGQRAVLERSVRAKARRSGRLTQAERVRRHVGFAEVVLGPLLALLGDALGEGVVRPGAVRRADEEGGRVGQVAVVRLDGDVAARETRAESASATAELSEKRTKGVLVPLRARDKPRQRGSAEGEAPSATFNAARRRKGLRTGMMRLDHHSGKMVDLKTSERELLQPGEQGPSACQATLARMDSRRAREKGRAHAHEALELAARIVGVDVEHVLELVLLVGRQPLVEAHLVLQLLARRVFRAALLGHARVGHVKVVVRDVQRWGRHEPESVRR